MALVHSFLPGPVGGRIITYHSVRPGGPGSRSSYVHPSDFSDQLGWLLQAGYSIVSLSCLAGHLAQGLPVPKNWVSITFDDGYVDNYVHAFPVLRKYGLSATIFLVTGKVDIDPLFLTRTQVEEMLGSHIEFGAHTVDHVSLSTIPEQEAQFQIEESGRQLDQLCHPSARHFCYPFGHHNHTIETFVRQANFHTCCTEQAGPVVAGSDPLRLLRVGILGTDTLLDFRLKVQGAYDWWINTYMKLEERRRRRRGGFPA